MRAARLRRRAAILGVYQGDSERPGQRWGSEWRAQYLVVDCDAAGSVRLPSGGFGTLLGAYQTRTLAEALAAAARSQGRRVEILDSRQLSAIDSSE